MLIGILDYGVGNLGSVSQALRTLNSEVVLLTSAKEVSTSDALILPGVGNYTSCMNRLEAGGWTKAISEAVVEKSVPILGICVGMQLLSSFGLEGANEEYPTRGLNLLPGKVVSIKSLGIDLRTPHMGWNSVSALNKSPLMSEVAEHTDFYFVHSYTFIPDDSSHIAATVKYGKHLTAAVSLRHIWGVQFHPEKSSKAGSIVLRNFIDHVHSLIS